MNNRLAYAQIAILIAIIALVLALGPQLAVVR